MVKYIVKKFLYGFLVLFGVITAIFFLFSYKQGDPALMAGGNHATQEVIDNIRKDLGLDLPIIQRYALYLNDLSPISVHNKNVEDSRIFLDTTKYSASVLFDVSENRTFVIKTPYLRRSYVTKRKVADIIFEKLPNTIVLAFSAMFFATIIGVIMGIISAINKGTFYDNSSFIIAVTGMSAPSFFMAAIISFVGGNLWAEQLGLPAFPLITFLLGLVIGVIVLFSNNKEGSSFNSKLKVIFSWGIRGLIIGFGIWIIYIIVFSIFNLGNIPVVGTSILHPAIGISFFQLVIWTFLLGALAGLIVSFRKGNKSTNSARIKQTVYWGGKAVAIGLLVWFVLIAIYSLFNLGGVPFSGTGLQPSGSLSDIDDFSGEEKYVWSNLILPSLTLGIRPLAIITQLTRSSLLDVLSQDYIRTAKAKGLSYFSIIIKHALKNALNPVITAISGWFASLLAGAVFVERVFGWDGIGNKLIDALQKDDLPLVMGAVIVISTFFVIINMTVDVIYGFLDPRVRIT